MCLQPGVMPVVRRGVHGVTYGNKRRWPLVWLRGHLRKGLLVWDTKNEWELRVMGSEEGEACEARSRQTHLVTGQMVDTSGLAGCLVSVAVIWLCRHSVRATIDVGKQVRPCPRRTLFMGTDSLFWFSHGMKQYSSFDISQPFKNAKFILNLQAMHKTEGAGTSLACRLYSMLISVLG